MDIHFAVSLLEGWMLETVYLTILFFFVGKILHGDVRFLRFSSNTQVYKPIMGNMYALLIIGSVILYVFVLPVLFIALFHIQRWGLLVGLGGLFVYLGGGIVVASKFEFGLDGIAGAPMVYTTGWCKEMSHFAFTMFLIVMPIIMPIKMVMQNRIKYSLPNSLLLFIVGGVCILRGLMVR